MKKLISDKDTSSNIMKVREEESDSKKIKETQYIHEKA